MTYPKKTHEQWIIDFTKKHNGKYSYPDVVSSSRKKITIICPHHGDFIQKAATHLEGSGCFKCALADSIIRLKKVRVLGGRNLFTNEQFLKNAKKIHSDKFEYLSLYKHSRARITLQCKSCKNIFEQLADGHLRGDGCARCARLGRHTKAKIFSDLETGFYINKKIWNKYIKGAKKRNLAFKISPEDVFNTFKNQNGLCALSKAKLICDSFNSSKINWSIDRIDNDKDYTPDNIMLVTKQINMFRNRCSIKEFIQLCNLVASAYNATHKYNNMSPEEKADLLNANSICYAKKKDNKQETSIESTSPDAIV